MRTRTARLLACVLASSALAAAPARDGQHDFDFEFGTWKAHLTRLQAPLSGSSTWIEYDGITIVRVEHLLVQCP